MTIRHVRGTQRDTWGTSLVGYVEATFDELVERWGMPNLGPNHRSSDGKVTCEWILKFGPTVVTVYDYKNGRTPFERYEWHVGSKSPFSEIERFVPGSRAS